jgi:hypothetical protein
MIRYVWAGATGIAALFLSILVANACKGKNYSDVGVPMYAHGDFGFLAGLGVYGIIFFLGFTLLKKIAKIQNNNGSPFMVIAAVFLFPEIYLVRWVVIF